MMLAQSHLVNVFPIATTAFGLKANWYETFIPLLVKPTYLLMTLTLVISIGIMVLKRFENVELEKKLWNVPIIIVTVMFWPFLVLGLKNIIDVFNTFLVSRVFQIPWHGFGFPELGGITNIVGWSAEGLARLLPNFGYWIVYSFYTIFFFFFAVLGPFVLAKGIIYDEIESILELIKELAILFLWQTTVVILVAFIMPEIVSGQPLPPNPKSSFYFLSLIFGIVILFTPSITRKFGNHLGSSFFPPGVRWGGAMLGLTAIAKVGSTSLATVGLPFTKYQAYHIWKHRLLTTEELASTYKEQKQARELKYEIEVLEHKYNEERTEKQLLKQRQSPQSDKFVRQLKKAKTESEA